MKRLLVIVIIVLVVIGTALVSWIGPRNVIGMLRYDRRTEGALRVGDPMPDVTLVDPTTMAPVALRDRRGSKPLVLVFGSYT